MYSNPEQKEYSFMNNVIEAIKSRRSIRKYKSEMIPMETIRNIVEAATYSPTGRNSQSPIMVVITDKALRDRLSQLNARIMGTDSDPFYGAPVVVLILALKQYHTYLYDGCSVIANLLLAAHSENIAGCWIHRAKEEFETAEGRAILKELGITDEVEGVGHCILGYPDCELPPPPPRKENYIIYR